MKLMQLWKPSVKGPKIQHLENAPISTLKVQSCDSQKESKEISTHINESYWSICHWVTESLSHHWVNESLSYHWVNESLSHHWVNESLSHHWVNESLSHHWVDESLSHHWVITWVILNEKIIFMKWRRPFSRNRLF